MKDLTPTDRAESLALYRAEIVGALTRRELKRGGSRWSSRTYRSSGSARRAPITRAPMGPRHWSGGTTPNVTPAHVQP